MNRIGIEWLLLLVSVVCGGVAATTDGRGHGFFRAMGAHGRWEDTRRVFGGAAAALAQCPRVCVLLDRYLGALCTGTVLAPHWVLTAAHCITPNVAYIKYNSVRPLVKNDGHLVAVQYLYMHPDYKVVQQDVGRGMDVTSLYHDMGLVRTRRPMEHALRSDSADPLLQMLKFNAEELGNQEVQVLGYGRTQTREQGDELLGVRLRLVDCERSSWRHCVCGVPFGGASSGVCSGDSGGPVLYRGVQVGVTSMGPLECAAENASWPARATSVFTAVHPYMDIINRTMLDADRAMSMLRVPPGAGSRAHRSLAVPAAALLLYLLM